ncbi:glycosyltransferase family 2 protein [Niabella beijingensis]|uniref:glycosyltransferase family 2 protein n=1 Tax=Niabella beijingensis TaxID=2872700 RepID=UPI001CBD69E2|nr:glycosyltransferase [Niabella beijingensis]MBZ4188328.1 glycosyltransferase [Niabella beijingensis]
MNIWKEILHFYDGAIFIYCMMIFLCYCFLSIASYISINKNLFLHKYRNLNNLSRLSLMPGISVIAPAFNEGKTIIYNVRSLLTLNYPKYEVVIVNDGSTDDTLEKLIREFKLIKVDFAYNAVALSRPVRGFYKSTDKAYKKLLVIDKENGRSKADAVNAGLNAAAFPYFLNTDVDCILVNDTLVALIQPFLADDKRVIAAGATLRMANSSEIDSGMMIRARPPRQLLPRFQEMEYIRSYVHGKMGWSLINAVPNVSGGLGLFDKEIALKVGGYDARSLGEDMDIVIRMCKYMCETDQEYAVRYIPQTLCWTEGPESLKVFVRQRVRWARGLWQIYMSNLKLLFNPRYKRLGCIVYPYNFFFELLAPIIETVGILVFIFLIIFGNINWTYATILLILVYVFAIFLTTMAILWDQLIFRQYKSWKEVAGLTLMAFVEPFIYHPVILYASIKGYIKEITGAKHQWGNMQRKGFEAPPPKKVSVNK